MPALGLFHTAIRTADLELTIAFYTRVLGLEEVARPASLVFPGAWLAVPGGDAIIHVYAGDAARGAGGVIAADNESGVVDHLAMRARGFTAYRRVFEAHGLAWREQNRPGEAVWQMFVHDPSGLKLELSFDQAQEPDLPVPIPTERRYRAAERWFDPAPYAALKRLQAA
jgi:catechol 2,3-dioxygenase-like lactoylglutathione lyase family enzyme